MQKSQQNIASFVLRFTQELWQDGQGEPHIQWRGQIRHVQGDDEVRFTDFAEAVAFIQRYLTQLTLNALPGEETMNQGKVLHESFRLWEQFAATYTNLMVSSMEQTLKQSEFFRKQMDESVKQTMSAWQLPPATKEKEILESLKQLQAQLQILASRVESLEQELHQRNQSG
jgi:hypothetical protein